MAKSFQTVPEPPSGTTFPGEITEDLLEIASYVFIGNGSPEGAVAAPIGSIYLRRDGTAGASLYLKEGGDTGNTGWTLIQTLAFPSELLSNTGFETDTSGWTTTNCTLTRDTGTKRSGAASGKLTASSAADMSITSATGTSGVVVAPGATYSISAYAFSATANVRTFQLSIIWYDSTGATISTDTSVGVSDAKNEWAGDEYTATAPSTARYAAVKITFVSPANTEVHFLDDISLVRTSTLIGYVTTADDGPRVIVDRDGITFYPTDTTDSGSIAVDALISGGDFYDATLTIASPSGQIALGAVQLILQGGTTRTATFNVGSLWMNSGIDLVELRPLVPCTSSTRPGNVAGRRIYETDTGRTYVSDGMNWIYESGPGDLRPWPGVTAPTNWDFAYGQSLSKTTYALLWNTLHTDKGTCTMTIASPCVVTNNGHGFSNGDAVYFTTTGALPTGLSQNTTYYVQSVTANTFRVSATRGGSDINTSGSQSGTHSLVYAPWGVASSTHFYAPDLRARQWTGRDDMGGSDAGRLAASNALGATGGEELHTMTTGELVTHGHTQNSHTHTIDDAGHTHTISDVGHSHVIGEVQLGWTGGDAYVFAAAGADFGNGTNSALDGTSGVTDSSLDGTASVTNSTTATNQNTGSSTPFNVMDPYAIGNWIIRLL